MTAYAVKPPVERISYPKQNFQNCQDFTFSASVTDKKKARKTATPLTPAKCCSERVQPNLATFACSTKAGVNFKLRDVIIS